MSSLKSIQPLPRKEFQVLEYLVRNPYQVITREQLIKDIWEGAVIVNERTIDVHIAKVRRVVGHQCIESVKSIGYRFVIPEEDKPAEQEEESG